MMAAPKGLDPRRENIPGELKDRDQWVGWKWKWVEDRWTKVPYDLKTGDPASSNDPASWSPYAAAEGHENIGFVFSEADPYCGIDLDSCIDPETGKVSKEARQIVGRFASYAEVSPSGTGVKIFVKARVPGHRRKNPQKRVELYDRLRYFTVTGHRCGDGEAGVGINERQEAVDAFYGWLFPEAENSPGPSANGSQATATNDLTDQDILSRASAAANGEKFVRLWDGDITGYGSPSEADLALCRLLAFWTGPDPDRIERMLSESGRARDKWHDRPPYRRVTIAKALEGMTEFYNAPTGATISIGRKKVGGPGREVGVPARSSTSLEILAPLPEAPSFPVEALPDSAHAFVEGAAEAIGCAVDLIAAPVLAVLSAGIGASRLVEIKRSWREGATLFIAVVAEPGDKKTPAANAARRPVMRRQAEMRSEFKAKKIEHERELREWKAECQRARKDGEVEPPTPAEPRMERVYADDTTVESLVGILEENPRGILIYKDELTGWIRSLDQYKGGKGADRQHWLSIWSNTPVVVDRKSRQGDPAYLDRPFVTLAGGIQPAMLPELGGSMEDGLLDRFLFAYPRHSATDLSDVEMEPGTEEGFARLYGSLCSLRMVEDVATGLHVPNVIPMSPDAKGRFTEIHDAIGRETRQPGFPGRLRGVWAKMRGYLARISLILALCRCAESGEVEQVEEEDIENAAKIVAFFQAHARRVYGKLGTLTTQKDPLAGELRSFLEDHDGDWTGSATDLYEELERRGASGLPANPEWLSKNVRSIAADTQGLTVGTGWRGKERILKLSLETTVGIVGAVGGSSTSANGTDSTNGRYEDGEL